MLRPTAVAGAALVLLARTGGRARTRPRGLTKVPARVVHRREPWPSVGTVGPPVHHHRPGWRTPRSPTWTRPWPRWPATATWPRRPAVTGNRQRHGPASQAKVRDPGLADESRGCAQCCAVLCRSESTPGSAVRAAGPSGTGRDPAVEASALTWSVTAMSDATGRRQRQTPEPATTWPPSPSRNRTWQSQPRFIASRQRQLLRLATAPITHYGTPLTSAQRNMITTQNEDLFVVKGFRARS